MKNIIKLLAVTLIVSMAFVFASTASAADLSDSADADYYYTDASYSGGWDTSYEDTAQADYYYTTPSYSSSDYGYDDDYYYSSPTYSSPSYSSGGSGFNLGCLLGGCSGGGSSSIQPRWTDYSTHYAQPRTVVTPAPVVATPAPIVNNNNNVNTNTNTVTVNVPAAPTYTPPVYQPPVYTPPVYLPSPFCSLIVSGVSVRAGNPLTLSWNAQSSVSGSITNIGSVNPVGSRTIYPAVTTTYVGNFVGQNGQSVTCSVTAFVSASQVPYVTLSQVPYTGLDLTPTEEVAYWGFLIAWCAFAAYLIVVKRAHVTYATSIKEFLFGSASASQAHLSTHSGHANTVSHSASAHTAPATKPQEDLSSLESPDEFIRAQIAKHTK